MVMASKLEDSMQLHGVHREAMYFRKVGCSELQITFAETSSTLSLTSRLLFPVQAYDIANLIATQYAKA